jgi:hypothetical protein
MIISIGCAREIDKSFQTNMFLKKVLQLLASIQTAKLPQVRTVRDHHILWRYVYFLQKLTERWCQQVVFVAAACVANSVTFHCNFGLRTSLPAVGIYR